MSRLLPSERLLQRLGGKPRFAPNASDKAIDASLKEPGAPVSGGVVMKRYGHRQSLGHLGEDKGHSAANRPGSFLITDKNKGTTVPGFDRVTLSFTRKGQIKLVIFDDKAHQKIGKISRVSAMTTNLEKNLNNLKAMALKIARDGNRPYGERVLYRAASMALTRIQKSPGQAIRDGRLGLTLTNHGGNLTGIGRVLKKLGMSFEEGRFKDKNGQPVSQKLNIRLASSKLAKRFGVSHECQIVQDLSRKGMLKRAQASRGTNAQPGGAPSHRVVRGAGAIAAVKTGGGRFARPAGGSSPGGRGSGSRSLGGCLKAPRAASGSGGAMLPPQPPPPFSPGSTFVP